MGNYNTPLSDTDFFFLDGRSGARVRIEEEDLCLQSLTPIYPTGMTAMWRAVVGPCNPAELGHIEHHE